MSKNNSEAKSNRVYLLPGQIIGCVGYTDLKISDNGLSYTLHSTEGGELDFYDEETDKHYAVHFDVEGSKISNSKYMQMYYEK